MQTTQPSTQAATQPSRQRDPFDELLDRKAIAKPFDQGGYNIPLATQMCWHSQNRYGWRALCTKLGSKVVIRRRHLEAWLDARTGLVQEPASKASSVALANASEVKR